MQVENIRGGGELDRMGLALGVRSRALGSRLFMQALELIMARRQFLSSNRLQSRAMAV